ncbi:MAG TPA: response regulator transcription factor [Polyangia bacterium]|nr:response regulator transcription factor [Polyangia bacterium]
MIRVLVVDDQTLFREGLRAMLALQGVEVVAEAADGEAAVKLASELQPDVVLMDLRMSVLDGVEATRRIVKLPVAPRVLVLTTFDDDEPVFEALRAGALGYLLKDTSSEKLAEAISLAARGESVLDPNITTKVVREFARISAPARRDVASELGLSEREIAVLRELARGASNKEIGVALSIAEGTVKNHVTNIFAKLGVHDRTQAALKGRELGIA